MNLSGLTDEMLDQKIHHLVRQERETLTDILHHLREAEARRLFSKFGFSSLFEYAVKRFGYSEDQAYRRIQAMKLLKEIPAIEEKIATGTLSLTNIAQVQSLFRNERKAEIVRSSEEKLLILEKIENCSKREAEKVLARESLVKMVGSDGEMKTFYANENLKAKLERLFEVKSHSNSSMELHELIEQMADLALETWDPIVKAKKIENKKAAKILKTAPVQKRCVDTETVEIHDEVETAQSRYIRADVRHALYLRDDDRCTNCGSRHAIEIDHIVPFAMGGTNELENLRLLCRSCNQRHAIEAYGANKMSSYLRAPWAGYYAASPYRH